MLEEGREKQVVYQGRKSVKASSGMVLEGTVTVEEAKAWVLTFEVLAQNSLALF